MLIVNLSQPQHPVAGRIKLESFQAQHPSQANQPKAFTSHSIQALITPHRVRGRVRVRVRVGWLALGTTVKTAGNIHNPGINTPSCVTRCTAQDAY